MSIIKLDFNKDKNKEQKLDEAFKNIGFLVISNYEKINKEMIDAAYLEAKEFFNLDTETKLKYSNSNEGYTPFGVEHAKDSQLYDLKEFFHIFNKNRKAFRGLTFPSIYKLMNELISLAETLLIYCDKNMDSPSHTTLANSTYGGNSVMRMLHYPPITGDSQHLRAAPHEDINLITLLIAATNPGLQVKTLDGKWLDIDCEPNNIIVNVGDMLQSYSNGYYKSTTHQVVNVDSSNSRYSLPYFIHPRSEFNVGPRSHMVAKLESKNYPDYTAGQYLDLRLKEIGLK